MIEQAVFDNNTAVSASPGYTLLLSSMGLSRIGGYIHYSDAASGGKFSNNEHAAFLNTLLEQAMVYRQDYQFVT